MSEPIPPSSPGTSRPPAGQRSWLAPSIFVGLILVAAILFVASSLRRPQLEMFAPSPAAGPESAGGPAGPRRYTIDASDDAEWQHFSFARGGLVEPADPLGWDIAFRRFHVIANGGGRFPGRGGIIDLGPVPFDSIIEAPADGYVATRTARDTVNPAIDHWYAYSWISHILEPDGHAYVVRTADGRYAKLRIVSYYCLDAVPGCMTFDYVYQGSGDRVFPVAQPARGPKASTR